MSKIMVKHSRIEISDYNIGDSPRIEKMFFIYDPVYHKLYYKGLQYDNQTKILYLPRGIDIFLLEKTFMESAEIDYNSDMCAYCDQVMIKYLPRNELQKIALRFLLGEGEYSYTKNKSQLAINLNTGTGKTYVTIMYIAYTCVKSIIITSSLDWLEQWKSCISEYTDISPNEIYFISGSSNIQALLKRDLSKYKIFLVSHNTLKSYGDTYGWDNVDKLFKYLKIGIKVYDEAHLNFENMCAIDFHTNTKKTLYLTATPARSDDDEDRIFKLIFKNIPAINLFDPDKDPRSKYIAMRFNSKPTPQEQSMCLNQYGFDRNKYTNYVINQENFYRLLHVIMDMIKHNRGKTLIYMGTNYSIKTLYSWILCNYPEYRGKVGIYTTITTENKRAQLDKSIILSTTKSCGAAVDISDLKMTIVLAEPFKSEVLARQTLGRTRANNTFYIDIVDDGFSATKRYYLKKLPIFEKYATECSEVRFNEMDLLSKSDKLIEKRYNMDYLFIRYDQNNKPYYLDPLFIK